VKPSVCAKGEKGSATPIATQRLQHFGHAAARPRRVDVQHRAAGERLTRSLGRLLEPRHPLSTDQRLESCRVDRLDVDLVEPWVLVSAHPVLPASLERGDGFPPGRR
jgi:hypothetical protein